jgi:hypothetical protein
VISSYALVVYMISIADLNVHLRDPLDRVLYLFYVRMSIIFIEGFNFKESGEDSYFFINVAAALLKP